MAKPTGFYFNLQLKIVLIVGLAVTVAFLVSGFVLLELDLRRSRRDLLHEYDLIAHIAAHDLQGSLAFEDPLATRKTLEALARHPELVAASVLDSSGREFAAIGQSIARTASAPLVVDHGRFVAGHATVMEPVELGGEPLGWLYLEWDAERILSQRLLAVRGLVLALLVGGLLAILVSIPVQRHLTAPLRRLTLNAERLRQGSAGPSPLDAGGQDEIGRLSSAFDLLLTELQQREEGMRAATLRAEALALDAMKKAGTIELTNARLRAEIREREGLQSQLLRSQRMDLLGQMAGGVAHDFNNLLTVIFGWAVHVEAKPDEPAHVEEGIRHIQDAASQAAGVTAQLLAFARKRPLDREPSRLGEIVRNVERLMRRVLPEEISLKILPPEQVVDVFVDAGQIEQVLMNLVVNARDAMQGQGQLRIRYGKGRPPAGVLEGFEVDPEADYGILAVEDNGPGIPPDVLAQVFEPYFTTKPLGEGTGLGLSVCYGIVQEHGGAIGVDSEVGEGSCFTVYLPLSVEGGAGGQKREVRALEQPVHATVLVVEDEEAVRGLITATFRGAGYAVLEAAAGPEALELARAHAGEIDLLVSDLRMPGMSGIELLSTIRLSWPELPAILVSGYFRDHADLARLEAKGAVRSLQKPFHPDELLRVAAKLLGVVQ